MAIKKTEIFIASRFDEFSSLRGKIRDKINNFRSLPLEAVDFNDGRVDRNPPVITCLSAVRQAEVMILILGDSYGSISPGQELSYTHLEYRAALDEDMEGLEHKSDYREQLCVDKSFFNPDVIAAANGYRVGGRFRMAVVCAEEGRRYYSRSALYFGAQAAELHQ